MRDLEHGIGQFLVGVIVLVGCALVGCALVGCALGGCAATPPDGTTGTGGRGGASGSTATGGSGGLVPGEWRQAQLTEFESFPDPNSEECLRFNGCAWAGQFAAVSGKQTLGWVMSHNIIAVHSKDFATYRLKTLRLRKDGREIDAVVYDQCSDNDCSGCCTRNASPSGFLIDVEKFTVERFGVTADGTVDWTCLDCR